jgi:hypothetical protein
MSCDPTRRRLLAAERPDLPPDEVRPHLESCAECRDWLHRLTAVETRLAALPVPPAPAKEVFLQRLRTGEIELPARVEPATLPWPAERVPSSARLKERGLKKMSLAFALAAAVMVLALGLWAWPHRDGHFGDHRSPVDIYAGQIRAERAERLARARTPNEHVKALQGFEESLKNQATDLARTSQAAKLSRLVEYYSQLVVEDLAAQADAVPLGDRLAVLRPVAEQLKWTESEMTRLVSEIERKSGKAPEVTDPLLAIADAATRGKRHLHELLRDAA